MPEPLETQEKLEQQSWLCSCCQDMLIRPNNDPQNAELFQARSCADVIYSIQQGCRLCVLLKECIEVEITGAWGAENVTITPILRASKEDDMHGPRGDPRFTLPLGSKGTKYETIEYDIRNDHDGENLLGSIFIELIPTESK